MTIIQPQNKDALLNRILIVLVISSILAAFSLTFLYARSVNLNHGMSQVQKTLEKLETENSELKDKIFAVLDRSRLEKIAAERGLIKEKNPQYFQIQSEPLALSH